MEQRAYSCVLPTDRTPFGFYAGRKPEQPQTGFSPYVNHMTLEAIPQWERRAMARKENDQGAREAFSQAVTAARAAVEQEAFPQNLSALVAARDKAQSDLVALEAEQAAIPAALEVARHNGDVVRERQLRQRAVELRVPIQMARIAVVQSGIAEMKARVNATKSRGTIAGRKEERTRLTLERAAFAHKVAVAVRKSYAHEDYELRLAILERERELQELVEHERDLQQILERERELQRLLTEM